jgi:hypothetical protein
VIVSESLARLHTTILMVSTPPSTVKSPDPTSRKAQTIPSKLGPAATLDEVHNRGPKLMQMFTGSEGGKRVERS